MKTIVGLFDHRSNANAVVQDLLNFGLQREDISLIANNSHTDGTNGDSTLRDPAIRTDDRNRIERIDNVGNAAADSALAGAAVGGVGAILLSLTALVIPGVGPVMAVGPLVAGLIGAGVGAAVGGLVGALAEAGVPEEQAGYYVEGVRRGGTLLSVMANEQDVPEIVNIMNRHNPVDVEERASLWRQAGWTGYSEHEDRTDRLPGSVSAGVPSAFDRTSDARYEQSRPGYLDRSHSAARDETEEIGASNGETWGSVTREQRNYGQNWQADYDESVFRTHYRNTYASTGRPWEDYTAAYRYGYDLRNEQRYNNRSWSEIEADARRDWSRNYPNKTWEDFKEAVRHGWERTKQAVGV